MADDKELFPGFREMLDTSVRAAVINAIADLDIVKLKLCQEKLEELTFRVNDAEMKAAVHEDLWRRYKANELAHAGEIAELKLKISLMESVIKNKEADSEVTAEDDERFNE